MNIVEFKGGLGNQMFQFAFMEALKLNGSYVKAYLGFYERNPNLMQFCLTEVFKNINLECISKDEFEEIYSKWRDVRNTTGINGYHQLNPSDRLYWPEETSGIYLPDVYKTKNCIFYGYWQTEKYFKGIRGELLRDFQFAKGEVKLAKIAEELKTNANYISVHVRRGDYIQPKFRDIYGDICTENYYRNAIQYIKSKIPNASYVFFSNDMEWVREHYGEENSIYVESGMFDDYHDWYDMYLMSCCSHNIIANSSFSWWGAWLNANQNKIVIAPDRWLNGMETTDIWCDGWIRIGNGEVDK
jgi:hypothetical protein